MSIQVRLRNQSSHHSQVAGDLKTSCVLIENAKTSNNLAPNDKPLAKVRRNLLAKVRASNNLVPNDKPLAKVRDFVKCFEL